MGLCTSYLMVITPKGFSKPRIKDGVYRGL
jgi:hypothetical protein